MTPEERLRRMMAGARGEDRVTESEWEGFASSARRSIRIQRMVAGAVAIVVLVAGGIGAAAVFGDGRLDGNVSPAESPSACRDIDAPDDPAACNYMPQPSRAPTPDTSPTTAPSDIELEYPPERFGEIWLVDPKTSTLSFGYRIMPGGGDAQEMLSVVIDELLRSPIASDIEAGYETEIPEGTELLDAEVVNGVAEINLSLEFKEPGSGDSDSIHLREAQIVFTATQVEGVDSARIFIEGQPFLGRVEKDRDHYDDVAPPIVLEAPKIGQAVGSPLTLTGSAMVFEATVSYEINSKPAPITADGKYTIKGFTTATCGSGCRGDFSEEIPFDVDKPTVVTLSVFEVSAEDGSHLHEISLPITLLPPD